MYGWENYSEDIQEYLYENNLSELSDNWIDDVCEVYDYTYDKDIDEYIFNSMYEEIEHLYKLKYARSPSYSMLEEFYFSDEYKEVKYNYDYYKDNEIKFRHGKLRSNGEKYLYNILMKEKVKFVFGESDGCKNDKTNRPLLFDFIIYYKGIKIYIEIQGRQHYVYNSFFYKNEEEFNERIYKDKIKRKFANENGVYIELDYSISDLDYLDEQIKNKLLPLIK